MKLQNLKSKMNPLVQEIGKIYHEVKLNFINCDISPSALDEPKILINIDRRESVNVIHSFDHQSD